MTSRRELLAAMPPLTAAAIMANSGFARAFPVPGEPVDAPLGNWAAVAASWCDGPASSDWCEGALIAQAMGGYGKPFGKLIGDWLAIGMGSHVEIIGARDRYLLPSLRAMLLGATDADGFWPMSGAEFDMAMITKAAADLDADDFDLGAHADKWLSGIVKRWNRMAPATREPAMTEAQRTSFFYDYLETATTPIDGLDEPLSWMGKRVFWQAMPSNASWGFAHDALRSWKEYGVL